jgi:hypothetical protein
MNETKSLLAVKVGFTLCSVLLGALTGCISHDDGLRLLRFHGQRIGQNHV